MKRMTKLVLASLLCTGALAAASPSMAAPGCKKDPNAICPAIFAPVQCDHNKTYSNQCFADADCATNCMAI